MMKPRNHYQDYGLTPKLMVLFGYWLMSMGQTDAYVQPSSGFAYGDGPYSPMTVSADYGLANVTTGPCRGRQVYMLNGTAMPEASPSYICFPIGMDCLRKFDTSFCGHSPLRAGRNVTYTKPGRVPVSRSLQSVSQQPPSCTAVFEGYRQDRNTIVLNLQAASTVVDGCFVSLEGASGNLTVRSGLNFATYVTKSRGARETVQLTFCTPSHCSGYSVSIWVADYCPAAPACWMCMEAVDQYACANPASKGWIDATKAALVLTILSSIMYVLSPILRFLAGYVYLLASCRNCVAGCCKRRNERKLPQTAPKITQPNAQSGQQKGEKRVNLAKIRNIVAAMSTIGRARALDDQEVSRLSLSIWQMPLTNAGLLVQDQGTCVPNNKGTMMCTVGASGLGHYDGTPNTCREWIMEQVSYGGATIESEPTVVRLCAVYYVEVYSLTFAAGVPDYGPVSRGHVWCNSCGDTRARPADAFCWITGCQSQTTGYCWDRGACNMDLVYGFGSVPRTNEWLNVHDLGSRTSSEIVFMAQAATRTSTGLKMLTDVQVLMSGGKSDLMIEGSKVFSIDLSAPNNPPQVSLPPGLRILDYPGYSDETYIGAAGQGGVTGTWPEVVTSYRTYDEWISAPSKQAVCPPTMVRSWSANCGGGWGAESVFTKVEDVWSTWKFVNEPSIAGSGVTLTTADRLTGTRTLLNVRVTRPNWPQVSVSIRAEGLKLMTTVNSLPCPVIEKLRVSPASLGIGTGGNMVMDIASTCGAGVSVITGWGVAGRASAACAVPATGYASCTLVVPLSSPDEEFELSASGKNGPATAKARIPASFEGVIQVNSTSVKTVASSSGSDGWKVLVDGLKAMGDGVALVFGTLAQPALSLLGMVNGDSSVNTWLSYLILALGLLAASAGIWYGVYFAQKMGYCKCKRLKMKKSP